MPEEGWVKFNTDRASKGNPGVSSYGLYVRDYFGDLIYTEVGNIGVITCIAIEAIAAGKALMFCNLNGFQQIRLEVDSFSLKDILRKEHIVEECMRLMQSINI